MPIVSIEEAGLDAFLLRHRARYRGYAVARLGRTSAAAEAVEQALESLATYWPRLVRGHNLSAGAWALVREAVSVRCRGPYGSEEADILHDCLPTATADAAVLHYRLGMRLTETAELMGIEPAAAAGLVLAAERQLPQSIARELGFGSVGA